MNRSDRIAQRAELKRVRRAGGDIALQDQKYFNPQAGWAMTKGGKQQYNEAEGVFNKEYGAMKGQLDSSKGQLTAAEAQLKAESARLAGINMTPQKGTSLESEWNKYQKGMKKFNVMTNGKVEATYLFPDDVAKNVQSSMDKAFFTNYSKDTGEYYITTAAKGKGKGLGGGSFVHKTLGQAQTDVKAQFYTASAPQVVKANQSINAVNSANKASMATAQSALGGQYDQLAGANATLQDRYNELGQVKSTRDATKSGYAKQYSNALAGRKKLAAVRTEPQQSHYKNLVANKVEEQ